ncbi:hypothetical protein BgiBS90_011212 [Biomphalaria glabrata]|nr:hypothetical protein BgiBS90_011212 [Biomphalaria glabrata]
MTLLTNILPHYETFRHMLPHYETFRHMLPHYETFRHMLPHYETFRHMLPHYETFRHMLPHYETFRHMLPHYETFRHMLPSHYTSAWRVRTSILNRDAYMPKWKCVFPKNTQANVLFSYISINTLRKEYKSFKLVTYTKCDNAKVNTA